MLLPTQVTIGTYHVYEYTFLDDLSFIRSPQAAFPSSPPEEVTEATCLVGKRFKESGWEGDGDIGIIWLPPFADVGVGDTSGTYIWHVKQRNNGISFLASDVPLTFHRLEDQNQWSESSGPTRKPISIIETCVNSLHSAAARIEQDCRTTMSFLESASGKPADASTIRYNLLIHYQHLLVRSFIEFMEDCYLSLLQEAIQGGNPHHIKLMKSKVQLDLSKYLPKEEKEDVVDKDELGEPAVTWFTLVGLISDLWSGYKWEPFKMKAEMLFKSVDYSPENAAWLEVRKHVILRNCVQHHEGQIDADSLRQLGRDKIEVKGDNGKTATINAWERITISQHEVYALCKAVLQVCDHFHAHIKKRVPTVHYLIQPEGPKGPTKTATPSPSS